jgi:hypothetical protein
MVKEGRRDRGKGVAEDAERLDNAKICQEGIKASGEEYNS